MLIQILAGILISIGLYKIAADIFRIPSAKTSKAVKSLAARQTAGESHVEIWLESLAVWISKRIKMNEYKYMQLESDLRTAEMNITPQMHVASAIVKAGMVGVFAIPAAFIFPLAIPVIVIFAIILYRQNTKSLSLRIQAKREAIEFELSRLVFTIEKTLLHSRDILSMLDSYRENAGPELKKQLDITTADMRSGNQEDAITRLEARVGSALLSDVCRGLQGILRGDDTIAYWSALAVKFADNQRMIMKRRAMKAPDKVRRLSMCLLFCFVLIYIVVIAAQIISSLDMMFG